MTKISTLIEDLLNVNRTKESQFTLKRTTFVVADLLEACCNHIRMAGKYNLTIEGDKYLTIFADEHAIDQVVVNFVNNAVKYAPGSLEIFLKIEAVDGAVKISVRPLLPGRIFRFQQIRAGFGAIHLRRDHPQTWRPDRCKQRKRRRQHLLVHHTAIKSAEQPKIVYFFINFYT
jgi:light-regulated signal transduction histidine kinase (bacteriophytochrome)